MKAFPLALIVISISIICILNIGLVSALNDDEISISQTWKTMTPYQGESTYVKLTLTSSSAEQLRIFRVGLHFDWMASGSFFTLDLTDDPVVFPSQGLHIFDSLVIQIPPNASIGSHSYFIGIDGAEAPYYESFSWDSPSFTLQIQESASSTFYELKAQVYNNITKAVNAAYQSAEAQSLLDQANTEYAHAIESEYESKWSEALLALQNASSYLEQAEVAERMSFGINLQTLLLIVAVVAIAIVVVVIIVVVMRRRRKKTDAAADVVDQSLETIEEQS
jgi:hypothetical protein